MVLSVRRELARVLHNSVQRMSAPARGSADIMRSNPHWGNFLPCRARALMIVVCLLELIARSPGASYAGRARSGIKRPKRCRFIPLPRSGRHTVPRCGCHRCHVRRVAEASRGTRVGVIFEPVGTGCQISVEADVEDRLWPPAATVGTRSSFAAGAEPFVPDQAGNAAAFFRLRLKIRVVFSPRNARITTLSSTGSIP